MKPLSERLKAYWDDPRFKILSEADKVLNSNKIWGGMEWKYNPIHPFQYLPLKKMVDEELEKLAREYDIPRE